MAKAPMTVIRGGRVVDDEQAPDVVNQLGDGGDVDQGAQRR